MAMTLNDLMSFGHIVMSDGKGNVSDEFGYTEYGPEVVYVDTDNEGQITSPECIDMAGYGDWELLSGFTGQWSYNGPIMHDSEYVGGALAEHIRETPGMYVAVLVDSIPPGDDLECIECGWAVAFKECA